MRSSRIRLGPVLVTKTQLKEHICNAFKPKLMGHCISFVNKVALSVSLNSQTVAYECSGILSSIDLYLSWRKSVFPVCYIDEICSLSIFLDVLGLGLSCSGTSPDHSSTSQVAICLHLHRAVAEFGLRRYFLL